MPVPGCWSLKHLVLTMQNFATCCRSLQYSVMWWNQKVNNSTGYGINRSPFCLHLVSLLHFYVLPLFNVNLFPDTCDHKNWGGKIWHGLKNCMSFTTIQHIACKWINPVYETDRKIISLSYGMVNYQFGGACMYQLANSTSVENCATSQNCLLQKFAT